MRRKSEGLAQSVQTRLVRHAHDTNVDPNLVMARFACERFLYRLSRSPYVERFVLKGALLLAAWLGEAIRPTRDADLLGFGDLSAAELHRIFGEICRVEVEPDGLAFDASTIAIADIRPEDAYGGKRIVLWSYLGPARLRVRVDVGLGDAVVPEPEWLDYPSLLDLPRPRLRAYRPETAIAEKVHAMVVLGTKNSRTRDFFDVHALLERESFDGTRLTQALRATFERRRTAIPAELPIALTSAFAEVEGKRAQWRSFLRRNRLSAAPEDFGTAIATLAGFLGPVLAAARRGDTYDFHWRPGGPWAPARAQTS
jgi:predicted nucleotidyltransferase component of viral defense system